MRQYLVVTLITVVGLTFGLVQVAAGPDTKTEVRQPDQAVKAAFSATSEKDPAACVSLASKADFRKANLQGSADQNQLRFEYCPNPGHVRYTPTPFCCQNGKLIEIMETCSNKNVWVYNGAFCIGLFCDDGPV